MEDHIPLQDIIGVDKKNPYFTIARNPQQPGLLYVYFGAALLEVVEDDREQPAFKLLLARLYNAGLKVKNLVEAFGVPYTTLRRWGEALKSGDAEQLMRILAGRQHPRKLSPEILSFAKQRFNDIYRQNIYTYSQQIRQEILEVFEVSVSGESLRTHFAEFKAHRQEASSGLENNSDETREESSAGQQTEDRCGREKNDRMPAHVDEKSAPPAALQVDNRKQTVVFEGYRLCHHAGVLLFSGFLNQLAEALGEDAALIKQWLVTVLLGASNIEQSKLLSWDALDLFLGDVVVNLNQQRQTLGELGATPCLAKLMQINGEWAGIGHCYDFYYDPHSKHYTGAHKTLKGWCSRLRFAEKVLHMDFIHTVKGFPVYISHDDNFYDLRERFFEVVGAFRHQFGFDQQRALTFVIDRGIYSLEVFEKILSDESNTVFVTWEKGYQSKPQTSKQWTGSYSLYKRKNSSRDLMRYSFNYLDEQWPRNKAIRRLIVSATNPKGNTIEVSILTNELHRGAEELIELMFSRWLQENDFKYLDNHFGINEITSYTSISYQELDKVLTDKQMKSGVYKALEKQRTGIKRQLKNRLLQAHRAKNRTSKQQQTIDQLTDALNSIEQEMAQTEKEVSRLASLIEQDYRKLDTLKKSLMDGIKITARNMFYLLLQPFKESYDNYRDDHVLFRHLTRSTGLIRYHDDIVEVLLLPEANFPPKVILIIEELLAQLNASRLTMPDGSAKVLHFRLHQKNNILFGVEATSGAAANIFTHHAG